MRSTLIAFLLLACVADAGFAQTLLATTSVHGIGARSCGKSCQRFLIMRPAQA